MGGTNARHTPFKVLLFDIGNVLVQWSPRNLYACRFSDMQEMQQFFDTCCTVEWHLNHDRGVPMADNAKPLIQAFPHWQNHIRAWQHGWAQMFDGPVPGARALLNTLASQNIPLYALTNMPAEVMPDLRKMFPFLELFRDIIVSGEEGVLKPDPAIFDIAAKRAGASAAEILFIDDVLENVMAARALGFAAIHFKDVSSLREELRALGLPL
jgi:2-haloacid dehalogenase